MRSLLLSLLSRAGSTALYMRRTAGERGRRVDTAAVGRTASDGAPSWDRTGHKPVSRRGRGRVIATSRQYPASCSCVYMELELYGTCS